MKIERMIGKPWPLAGRAHRSDDDLIGPQAMQDFKSGNKWNAGGHGEVGGQTSKVER